MIGGYDVEAQLGLVVEEHSCVIMEEIEVDVITSRRSFPEKQQRCQTQAKQDGRVQ